MNFKEMTFDNIDLHKDKKRYKKIKKLYHKVVKKLTEKDKRQIKCLQEEFKIGDKE